ncbi:PfkB family carbohydrate kinase [Paracoccus cavernae]|uniref:PfkB family carbohydrate kinase n=1 Tax=Paracoccus cavernae TaxID=1571207 RepID=A0ABT8D3C5_9RHOB|nr:PfkB family carbohydrate kinase [Paracoccus cavernae]
MPASETTASAGLVCIGAMLWDIIGRSSTPLGPGDDVPGRVEQRPGGVAFNIALALATRGFRPVMLSSIGSDASGAALADLAETRGVDSAMLHRSKSHGTDIYMAIEAGAQMLASVADARALEAAGAAILAPLRDGRLGDAAHPWAGMIILDSNLAPEIIAQFQSDPCLNAAELVLVPASPAKAARLESLLHRPKTSFYLNRREAEVLAGRPLATAAEAAEAILAAGAARVIVTDGPHPLAEAISSAPTLVLTPPPLDVTRVTGAGDFLLSAHLEARLSGLEREAALASALAAVSSYVSGKDIQ